MELEEIYSQNRVALKKIKKQSTASCVLCGLFLCMILFELYYAVMISPIFVLLAVIVAAVSVTGFIGITKNDNHWSTASLILLAVHLLVFTAIISDSLSDVVVALVMSGTGHGVFAYFTYRTMQNNKKYHWLEQQEGFPHFEVKQTMYDMDKRQREIKDPFQIKKEQIESRNQSSGQSGQMEEL